MTTPADNFPPGVPYRAPASTGAAGAASTQNGSRPRVLSAVAVLDGTQLVAQAAPPAGRAWLVRRITVRASDAASSPAAYVYIGQDVRDENLASGTSSGAFDENDTNTPLFVPEGDALLVAWTTGTGTAGFRLEYDEV